VLRNGGQVRRISQNSGRPTYQQVCLKCSEALWRAGYEEQLAAAGRQLPLDFENDAGSGSEDYDFFHSSRLASRWRSCRVRSLYGGDVCHGNPVTRLQNEEDIFGSL
jgi:hypothetical protein